MKHRKLKDLKTQFELKQEGEYGWLESTNRAEKKLVLVHGVTGGKDDMLPLAVEYEAHGYHVYCLDLPGHGDSSWPGEMSFADLAKWLKGFITLIGEPEVLVSNSFSSAVVYAYMQRGYLPAKTHVILGCPTPDTSRLAHGLYRVGGVMPKGISWHLYTMKVANGLRTSMMAKKRQRTPVRWLIESEKRKRSTLHPHAGLLLSGLIFSDNPYQGERISEDIQRRMTVIIGTKDNVVSRRAIGTLKNIMPFSRHILAQGSGHILHFEAVSDYVDLIDKT